MSVVQTLRRQHSDIAAAVTTISAKLRPDALKSPIEAAAMRIELSKLAVLIRVHLSMEDNSLYPSLVASKDSKTATTAQRFVHDMTPITSAFGAYMTKWPNSGAIAAKPAAFVLETQAIFKALGSERKIFKEEEQIVAWAREAVVSEKPITKGTVITSEMVWVKRPSPGPGVVPAKDLKKVIGKRAKSDIPKDTQIKWDQLEG